MGELISLGIPLEPRQLPLKGKPFEGKPYEEKQNNEKSEPQSSLFDQNRFFGRLFDGKVDDRPFDTAVADGRIGLAGIGILRLSGGGIGRAVFIDTHFGFSVVPARGKRRNESEEHKQAKKVFQNLHGGVPFKEEDVGTSLFLNYNIKEVQLQERTKDFFRRSAQISGTGEISRKKGGEFGKKSRFLFLSKKGVSLQNRKKLVIFTIFREESLQISGEIAT